MESFSQEGVCNPKVILVYKQSEGRNIQVLRLDDIPFAVQTDYILSIARLHTNPSDWIKNKTVRMK